MEIKMKTLAPKIILVVIALAILFLGPSEGKAFEEEKDPYNVTRDFCYDTSEVNCDNDKAI
jgi:hypothetical protein